MSEDKELISKEVGEADFDVSFVDGKLRMEAGLDSKGVSAGAFVVVKPEYFLDKLKEAIPGEVDDLIIDMLKAAFVK